MKVTVKYCGYCRKDGSYNTVTFDTEKKIFTNKTDPNYSKWKTPWETSAFVEAYMSKDVDSLREKLISDGYQEED